jgi:hypothetical protein
MSRLFLLFLGTCPVALIPVALAVRLVQFYLP